MDTSDPKTMTVWLARAVTYVLYAWILVSEFILAQGFLLKLFGANPDAGYADWAYRSLDRVMEPFRGIFTPIELDGDAILDTSVLFAMFIYAVLALVIRAAIDWLTHRLNKIERERQLELARLNSRAGFAADRDAPDGEPTRPAPQTTPRDTPPAA